MITWECRQCGEGMEAPDSAVDEFFECPKCGIQTSPRKFMQTGAEKKSSWSERAERVMDTADRVLNTPIVELPERPDRAIRSQPEYKDRLDRCIHGSQWVIGLGVFLFLVGWIIISVAMNMDRTSGWSSDTLNLGKLNDQLVYTIIGTGLVGAGAVMFAIGLCAWGVIRAVVVTGSRGAGG